jgi:hypothetical protein
MRNVNWAKMPTARVKLSVWGSVEGEDKLLDPASIDQLVDAFTTEVSQPSSAAAPKKRVVKEAVPSFLDPKRANTVGILIGRIKLTNAEMCAAIINGDKDFLTLDTLHILKTIAPSEEEAEAARTFAGDESKLGRADQVSQNG